MISYEDCVALCGLSRDEIAAIAEHQRVPEMVAVSIGHYLLQKEHGPEFIRDMIIDDVRVAQKNGDKPHVQELLHALHHFLRDHPEARTGSA
jgi:hypothetical protein